MKHFLLSATIIITIARPSWADEVYDKNFDKGKNLAECAGLLRAISQAPATANFPKVRETLRNKANLWELAAAIFIASNERSDSEEVVKDISMSSAISWGAKLEVNQWQEHKAYWATKCAPWQTGVDALADEMRKNP